MPAKQKRNVLKGYTAEDKRLAQMAYKTFKGNVNDALRHLKNEELYGRRFASLSYPTLDSIWLERGLRAKEGKKHSGRKDLIAINGKGYLTPVEEAEVLKQYHQQRKEGFRPGKPMYKIIGNSFHKPKSQTVIELYLASQGLVESSLKKNGGLEKKVK